MGFLTLLLLQEQDSPSPVTLDHIIEMYNQVSIYRAKKDFTKDFWRLEKFVRDIRPKWTKWQKARRNHFEQYTPRVEPQHGEVEIQGVFDSSNNKESEVKLSI